MTRVHEKGPPPAPGLWPARNALQPVVTAIVIKRCILRPEAEEDLEPFPAAGVTVIMDVLFEPEHVELRLVPAADDVEAEAAAANVIGRDDLLRRKHWRKERHMHGAKHGEALSGGQQAARPGHGLERAALEIGRAAIALPAPDRHQTFEAGRISHLGKPDVLLESVLPALRHGGRGTATRAIRAEDGKLEPIAAEHGGIALDIHTGASRALTHCGDVLLSSATSPHRHRLSCRSQSRF